MFRVRALLVCCLAMILCAIAGVVVGHANSPVVASAQDYPTQTAPTTAPTTSAAPSPRTGRSTVTDPFAAIDSDYARLGKDIDDLKARWPHPTPSPTPTPTPSPTPQPQTGTVFGVDVSPKGTGKTWQQVADEARAQFGALPHVREFSPSTPLTAHLAGVQPSDHGVVSFKSWNLADFNKWMDSLTAESWVSYWHESEDDAKKSGNPAAFIANWQNVYRQMDAARKVHPHGHLVKIIPIFMWYQEVPAKQAGVTMADYLRGLTGYDAIGLDCYSPGWGQWSSRYATPQELFDPVINEAKAHGVPWAAPELGAVQGGWDGDGSALATAITNWKTYAKAHGALWVNWWDAVGTQRDFRLSGKALAAWKAAV